MEKIFEYVRKNNISDIHIIEGERIYFRKDGEKEYILEKMEKS